MTDDRNRRTAAALEEFRRVAGPPALSAAARAMIDDTLADLAVLLTGRSEAPECFAPVYSLTADGGSLRLRVDWTFDPAGINRFAAALKEDDK